MICQVCGRNVKNDEANFCDYCGASLRDRKTESMNTNSTGPSMGKTMDQMNWNPYAGNDRTNQQVMYEQHNYGTPNNPYRERQNSNAPVSVLKWLGIMLLPIVPYIGTIGFLVILFSWGFGRETNPTKKNWARAMLILFALALLFTFAFYGEISSMISSALPSTPGI